MVKAFSDASNTMAYDALTVEDVLSQVVTYNNRIYKIMCIISNIRVECIWMIFFHFVSINDGCRTHCTLYTRHDIALTTASSINNQQQRKYLWCSSMRCNVWVCVVNLLSCYSRLEKQIHYYFYHIVAVSVRCSSLHKMANMLLSSLMYFKMYLSLVSFLHFSHIFTLSQL